MYDYIIIGAGSAGCVVANRLSKDPANKVLLLEAGPKDSNPMIHMPGGCAEVLKSKTLNWHFYSTPQKHLNGRKFFVPRGRMLGGSSGANGMVYIRGHRKDYDDWAAKGLEGWSYADVLPYFKEMEDQVRGADHYHGSTGELHVANAPSENVLFDLYVKAGEEMGIVPNNDFNGETQEGIGRFQCTIKQGKRWSSASAFLTPIRKTRKNLHIVTGAHVTRLVLDGNKVTGVEYQLKNKKVIVNSNKEVILSAGTIQSPQILQLSGIGDRDDLTAAGIETKIELPGVGKNLQEHLDVLLNFGISQPISMNGIANSILKQMGAGIQYILTKKGPVAGNSIEAGGFIKTLPELDRPDVQLHYVPANMYGLIDQLPKEHGVILHACNLRPKSRGTVKAVSTDPYAHPEIDFNFMAHEEDWQTSIRAFNMMRDMMKQSAWGDMLTGELSPGPNVTTEQQIRDSFSKITETVYHPVGTCKMGNDDMAVVDNELRVRGIEGLRVADVSVIPDIIGGNTNAPAMMIGNKCAAMILGNELAQANVA